MRQMIMGVTAIGLVSWACSSARQDNARSMDDRIVVTMRGVIRVVGADPAPQVAIHVGMGDAARQVAVTGPLRDEIGRLNGLEVRLVGSPAQNPMGLPAEAFEPSSYDIVSVNGEPAYVGLVMQRDGEMWLDMTPPVKLLAVPSGLRNRIGAKVWVTGAMRDGALSVQAFGVIRDP